MHRLQAGAVTFCSLLVAYRRNNDRTHEHYRQSNRLSTLACTLMIVGLQLALIIPGEQVLGNTGENLSRCDEYGVHQDDSDHRRRHYTAGCRLRSSSTTAHRHPVRTIQSRHQAHIAERQHDQRHNNSADQIQPRVGGDEACIKAQS